MEESQVEYKLKGKKQQKSKWDSEKILKIWKKSKLNTEKIWKIWKKIG